MQTLIELTFPSLFFRSLLSPRTFPSSRDNFPYLTFISASPTTLSLRGLSLHAFRTLFSSNFV